MSNTWKQNWPETKQHFLDWWNQEGLIIASWGAPRAEGVHAIVEDAEPAPSIKERYTTPERRARRARFHLARCAFSLDTLPVADTDMGPGSLATFLGSEPGFSPETVWFHPCIDSDAPPEDHPPLRFDPNNPWWRLTEETVKQNAALAQGNYFVGFPDLVENIDILASLRGTQPLMHDFIERPEWVIQKVQEINQAWFEAYSRIYDIIKAEDGSSVWGAFRVWGPGKAAKLQCDASALFSPAMFEQFVVPALTEQCEWLGHSMFHVDGPECLNKVDALLAIDALDALEWTPGPQVPQGGSPEWYPLYRRILEAGKSVQALGVMPSEIIPLLDAAGGKGMYILTAFPNEREAEDMAKQVEPYR